MVKFIDTEPHKYYLGVLEHFGIPVHKYYTRQYGLVKRQPIRYNFFIAKITFENKTGYIFGPMCGDDFSFPDSYFNGEKHRLAEDDEISDLDDYPKEYNEELDAKLSLLQKSRNMLLYGWSDEKLRFRHLDYRCDECRRHEFTGNMYTCDVCVIDEDDTYDLCEDCYLKTTHDPCHSFTVIPPPEGKPIIYDEAELVTELERQHEEGNSNYGGKLCYRPNKFEIIDTMYDTADNGETVHKELVDFFAR